MMMEILSAPKKLAAGHGPEVQLLLVDNDRETMLLVRESMPEIVRNVLQISSKVPDGGKAERDKHPLASKNTGSNKEKGRNLFTSLSPKLKKALLLMAMDCFENNRESACRALGLTPEELDEELRQAA